MRDFENQVNCFSVRLIILAAVIWGLQDNCPVSGAEHDQRQQTSSVCSLDAFVSGGQMHLLLGEKKSGDEATFKISHRVSMDGGKTWRNPITVNADAPAPHMLHRGSDARVAVAGSNVLAVWTTKGTDKWGSGPLVTMLSSDGGQTWKLGPNPADDGRTDGHGFVAAGATESGVFQLAWLDNRGEQRGLRFAKSDNGGWTWSTNATAVPRTCECCWNAITPIGKEGAAVLYRAISPRDMAVVLTRDSGRHWSIPVPVGTFGWDIQACPHVGGALASTSVGGRVSLHAMVWTGQANQAGVYHSRSEDEGRTWSAPKPMGIARASHPHLCADARGRVAAVWDQSDDNDLTTVWASISRDQGLSWSVPRRLSESGKTAEHPRVVPTSEGFRVFWTGGKKGEGTQWSSIAVSPDEEQFGPGFSSLIR
jgi:hypothetical protein